MIFIRKIVYRIPVSPSVQEGILEALRLAVMAFISTLLTELIEYFQSVPNQEFLIMFLTIVLRYFDKWKYESNKIRDVEGSKNTGLIGF